MLGLSKLTSCSTSIGIGFGETSFCQQFSYLLSEMSCFTDTDTATSVLQFGFRDDILRSIDRNARVITFSIINDCNSHQYLQQWSFSLLMLTMVFQRSRQLSPMLSQRQLD